MERIGVDIGGTGIKAGIVSQNGIIIGKKECPTDTKAGFNKVISDIRTLVMDLLDTYGRKAEEIEVLGFGVPSFINQRGEVTCVNLNWYEEDFMEALKEKFPEFNIGAENDATVAAIAESKFGSMKGYEYGIFLTLGTGVGGGIIINGKPFVGAHGMGSEIGHMVIGRNEFDCKCGNNGCFETFCSATGITQYTRMLLEKEEGSILRNKDEFGKVELSAKMIFEAYRLKDELAIKSITRFKEYLAIALANIINFFDPHIIAIGGGVSRASDIILDGLEDEVRKHILYKNEEMAQIVAAKLGNEAGIIGAAFLEPSINKVLKIERTSKM